MSHARRRIGWLVLAAPLLWACREHLQQGGHYSLAITQVTQDGCGIVPNAGPLGSGELSRAGDLTRFQYDQYGMVMVGAYQEKAERFYLDGSVPGASVQVRGATCTLDLLSIHLDAVTDTATTFHGTAHIQYQATNADACACEAWVAFTAAHQ